MDDNTVVTIIHTVTQQQYHENSAGNIPSAFIEGTFPLSWKPKLCAHVELKNLPQTIDRLKFAGHRILRAYI